MMIFDPPTLEDDLLLDLDPIKAIDRKYKAGLERYGPAWVGKRPIYEAHDELLDLGAYLMLEHQKNEIPNDLIEAMIREALDMIRGVRVAIAILEGKQNA
tara:strand:- start:100 stop:399 length:300 start_codon:yes stop_codon:yes gene_type:complete